MLFRAFLSYTHADAAWARWLLRRLETYRVPPRLVGTRGMYGEIQPRLGTFFRDREELPSSGDLGATIRHALAESEALIVVCSPAAARSRWVNAEVEAFRASGRSDRVLCFVVAGEPGSAEPAQQCFPPALLAQTDDGSTIEPLAADARRYADGRERAFVKLVAGLLGIGFDRLAQREAQRRTRRLAFLAAASVAGMAIASTLAVIAYVARNDAQRRQAQAEDILGFMLGDLRQKLTRVGRLDLMRAVDDKATSYFATLDPRDLSDRALEEQARSLTGIGQVRLDEGNYGGALAAFREAHARSGALYARQTGNGRRLFDLAQAEFWIGYVAWKQGLFDEAERWFLQYRDTAIKLAAMDRNNFDWQQEVAYAYHNLAVLDESRGRYAEAEQAMREQLVLRRTWAAQRPNDTELQDEVADAASWLGTLMLQQGRLSEAEAFFDEAVRVVSHNRTNDPNDARWKDMWRDKVVLLAEVQAKRGRLAEARANVRNADALARALTEQDVKNFEWQVGFGICRWWQAQLDAVTSPSNAAAEAIDAETIFAAVHTAEPEDQRALRWLARTFNLQTQLALADGRTIAARERSAMASKLLEPQRNHPDESLRIVLADTLVLAGETAQRTGDLSAATAAWQRAQELLLADATNPLPFGRLDPLVRVLRHLDLEPQAQPHRERLSSAGYVPLRPFPMPATAIATR